MGPSTSPAADREGPASARGHEQCRLDGLRQGEGAILRRYDISEETYRQRFRSTRRKEGEAYGELVVRLQDLLRKWITGCNSVETVLEKVAMEQLLNTMPPELRVWVSERKPTTGCEAGGWLMTMYRPDSEYQDQTSTQRRLVGQGRNADAISVGSRVIWRGTAPRRRLSLLHRTPQNLLRRVRNHPSDVITAASTGTSLCTVRRKPATSVRWLGTVSGMCGLGGGV